MADLLDISDSTDWLSTTVPAIGPVEASLRCQVCKDFYHTPMLTTCDHTFCSLCIRRVLSQTSKCPLCLSPTQESKLRKCAALEAVVEAFSTARPALIEYCRTRSDRDMESTVQRESETASSPASKRARDVAVQSSPETRRSKRLRSSVKQNVSYQEAAVNQDDRDGPSRAAADQDSEYQDTPNDNLFPCPICNKRMKEELVFSHLDTCGTQPTPKPTSSKPNPFARLQSAASAARPVTPDRLPALNYSLIKDVALRKKLAELGLSTQGPRTLLERRHKEWTTLWNSNCDAARPKRKAELLRDLDQWERVVANPRPAVAVRAAGTGSSSSSGGGSNGSSIKEKDFDGSAWAAKHESSFKDLIASARRSREQATKTAGQKSGNTPGSNSASVPDSGSASVPDSGSASIPQQPQQQLQQSQNSQQNQEFAPNLDTDMVILDEKPEIFDSTSISVTQQTETLKLADPQSETARVYPDEIPSSSQLSDL
ncbi:hypothetical protein TD95_003012 [Thielaviopsis punctulata]|uniref:Postreplication repair E3 ubiquitin-protein ligase RAD18 n=1 Tax=Thielaviopsis punctulata TaxID=72032 RepID=A0A0F4ZDW6_9PEZI|nr:hypothetical protein TD95_003012 [Thielaviopsis punctulata]